MDLELTGKTVLITGGTDGLGLASRHAAGDRRGGRRRLRA